MIQLLDKGNENAVFTQYFDYQKTNLIRHRREGDSTTSFYAYGGFMGDNPHSKTLYESSN